MQIYGIYCKLFETICKVLLSSSGLADRAAGLRAQALRRVAGGLPARSPSRRRLLVSRGRYGAVCCSVGDDPPRVGASTMPRRCRDPRHRRIVAKDRLGARPPSPAGRGPRAAVRSPRDDHDDDDDVVDAPRPPHVSPGSRRQFGAADARVLDAPICQIEITRLPSSTPKRRFPNVTSVSTPIGLIGIG